MRQEQFNQIVNLLDTDVNFGISVYNLSNGVKPIEVSKTKEEIIAKYGSLENFFNGLFKNGVTEIGIQPRRKNGKNKGQTVQNWIDHPNYKYEKFSLNPTEAPVQQNAPVQPVVSSQYSQPGLNGGLSLPEMISLHVDRNDKTRLETENRFLKEENDRLKKENWEHKESALEKKYSSEKSSKNTEIVNTAIANLDKLSGLITAFKGQAIAPVVEGLGNPNLTPQKRGLIDVITQADDFTINLVTHLYNGIATDTPLTPELTELLKKHKIIE